MRGFIFVISFLWILTGICPAFAHELRPAYLELKETSPSEFNVVWKIPMFGTVLLPLEPQFSGQTKILKPATIRTTEGAVVKTWQMKAIDPLRGQTLKIVGLEKTGADALIRMEFSDGSTLIQRLVGEENSVVIPNRQSLWQVAWVYLLLGFEHILLGIDHLLFVFGLLLIVRGRMTLLKTVTAFTVAHSITLAIATLGYASAPLPPLNAAIALSIFFLGPEIVRVWRGETSLAIRRPWWVAFAFGLLHGFGFASGLSTTGMSRAAIPQALLFFNVGVELGQLLFVGLILAMERAFEVLRMRWPIWAQRAPGYAIGVCGAFWTIQRTFMMFKLR